MEITINAQNVFQTNHSKSESAHATLTKMQLYLHSLSNRGLYNMEISLNKMTDENTFLFLSDTVISRYKLQ